MNPGRARRVFWWGLAASVLLHLGLLSGAWVLPPLVISQDEPLPLTARLVSTPPPVKAVTKSVMKPVTKPVPQTVPPEAVPAASPPPAPPEPLPEPAESLSEPASPEPDPQPAAPTAPALAEISEPPLVAEAIPPAPPPTPIFTPLPRRLTLEYRARYGPASGRQILVWVHEGDYYSITSIVSPEGLASLFFSGQLVQTSRGRIVAAGLQPEEFSDQRGDKRSQSRFDYATRTVLSESSKGARTFPLPAGLQDAQSLLFQLALTAPPPIDSDSAVFNGRKIRNYRYRVTGEENLDTPLGVLRTLHIARLAESGAERFEIWLAIDHYYLPVKLASEISGLDAELMVQSISSEN